MEDQTPSLPEPRTNARWRWSTPGRALLGGGVLAAVLSLAPLSAAGASTSHNTTAPAGAKGGGRPPAGAHQNPTAAGKITALSGDDITIVGQGRTTQSVVYTSSTTFRDMSGTTSASVLKVGAFISAAGTKASDGTVTATSIMVGEGPPPIRSGAPGAKGTKPPGGRNGAPGAS
ncbi:MAG TPA: DUF5666 domain-containing protein [Acidimicrobiales bacterium]|jgi:hypothetical protein